MTPRVSMVLIVIAAACSQHAPGSEDTASLSSANTTSVQHTGGSGTTTPPTTPTESCDLAPAPLTVAMMDGQVTEGMAFDDQGALLGCSDQHLFATYQGQVPTVLAPGIGVHGDLVTLSDGRVILAHGWNNKIVVVHANGASETLLDGLSFPNGLAVGSDDTVYVAEWFGDRVLALDPDTGSFDVLTTSLQEPFGIALSVDEQTLYVAASNGPGGVWSMPVGGGDPTPIEATGGHHAEGLRMDRCGVLYLLDVDGIFRYQLDIELLELVVVNPDPQHYWGGFTAGEFGSGVGGWDSEKLYTVLYGMPAQVVEVTLR